MGRKITWHCKFFSTTGDPGEHPHWSPQHPPLSSCINPPAHHHCNHLHGGSVHKCCFLQTTERKRKLHSPSIPAGRGSETHSAPTSQGLFACIFSCCLPFCTRSVGMGRGFWVFVGFDFTEQTLALPCLNSSQEVFFTSSTPTFAIQHPKRTG